MNGHDDSRHVLCSVCRSDGSTGEACYCSQLSLAEMRESVVVNPSAIGNPDETPVVFVGADLRALLNPCECGGVNGFHRDGCARRSVQS